MSFLLFSHAILVLQLYSFEKRTIESHPSRDERGKEDGHGPFFRSGYVFLREQEF